MKKHKFVLMVEETMFNNTFKDEFIVETDSLAEAFIQSVMNILMHFGAVQMLGLMM